ncbi:NADH-quinone oxidoreductase subunit NuoH [Anaerolineales bacterium HSG6]|nr:NADH-quinone oxidoreductase subunit NuoH [Anaerolineales bacterium HSG6]MDM8530100.1 NADH-quinone oxidoreductase subunit NuoH [Anaerolineales bacterium HSG25]
MSQEIVQLLVDIVKLIIIASVIMGIFTFILLVERKLIGRFTRRYGPNRVGPFGLLQSIADAVKMMLKEEMVPGHVDKVIYVMAPGMALMTALSVFAVIPFARDTVVLPLESLIGFSVYLTPWVADINVGVLYLLAVGSLGSYGIILGGWSSNNKYSLLGALRTSAQMLSYELPLGVAVLSVVVMTGTLRVTEIVEWQTQFAGLAWIVFLQPVAFLIFFISALAEAGRAPFDLPETENELIGGFMTEYGALKFGLFQAAEFVHAMMFCTITVTVFLGGWNMPFLNEILNIMPTPIQALAPVLHLGIFIGKSLAVYCSLIWIRASVPRMRFDQLMAFCWKWLLPIALLNLFATVMGLAITAELLGLW